MNILIVDDNEIDLSIINNAIKAVDGIKTSFARSADKAIELAIEDKPDLIILDVAMPTVDGIEVKSRLMRHPITALIPVVFITGDEDSEKDCYRVGAIDFLTKPIDMPRLISIIQHRSLISMLNELQESNRKWYERICTAAS